MLILSGMIAIVDATFWSVGAVYSAREAVNNPVAGLWLSAYMVPSLLAAPIISRWKIYKKKKRWAAGLLFVSGGVMSLLAFKVGLTTGLGVVFVASMLGALSVPLLDAVYSDLAARMGRERKHLIGLTGGVGSMAYIVGPVLAGFMSDKVGELGTFAAMGIAMMCVSMLVIVVLPVKVRLPQAEIKDWVKG